VDERRREADVAEPVVKREQLDRLARPAAQRVVAERQQQASRICAVKMPTAIKPATDEMSIAVASPTLNSQVPTLKSHFGFNLKFSTQIADER